MLYGVCSNVVNSGIVDKTKLNILDFILFTDSLKTFDSSKEQQTYFLAAWFAKIGGCTL